MTAIPFPSPSPFPSTEALGEGARIPPNPAFGWRDLRWPAVVATCLFAVLGILAEPVDSGLGSYYQSFAAIIRAGFSAAAATKDTITFPMWGYGYLLLLTQSPAALRWIQFLLAVGASLALIRELAVSGVLTAREARLASWALVLALPWHSFQLQTYSANSVGSSLLLLSLWHRGPTSRRDSATRHESPRRSCRATW